MKRAAHVGLFFALIAQASLARAQGPVLGPEAGPTILGAIGRAPLDGGWSLSGIWIEGDRARLGFAQEELTAEVILVHGTPPSRWFAPGRAHLVLRYTLTRQTIDPPPGAELYRPPVELE